MKQSKMIPLLGNSLPSNSDRHTMMPVIIPCAVLFTKMKGTLLRKSTQIKSTLLTPEAQRLKLLYPYTKFIECKTS